MARRFSRFLIAAAQSGSGKTTVTLGLLRALHKRGVSVQPFKCGPDYIDPGFHRSAAERDSINLDSWMMGEEGVQEVWNRYTSDCDVALIEGVMGLFDGIAPRTLEGSSADISRLCSTPVILVVDAKGMSGSIAPLVAGYASFHPEVHIAGVIANKVGSQSHANLLREALELASLPPLLGYLPRDERFVFPERHLGLVPQIEALTDASTLDLLAKKVEKCVKLDTLLECTSLFSPRENFLSKQGNTLLSQEGKRIAVAYDEAFHFYYRENLTKLERAGAELVYFSPLKDKILPEADMLYIGGGFPEVFAEALASNSVMLNAIRSYVGNGGAIFAECGGYVYLCNSVTVKGETYTLCGVINGEALLHKKRQALGYRIITPLVDIPFLCDRSTLRGHEYHYTSISLNQKYTPLYRISDRHGDSKDVGVQCGNICAAYPHLMW